MSGMSKYSRVLSLLLGGALWVGGAARRRLRPRPPSRRSLRAAPSCGRERPKNSPEADRRAAQASVDHHGAPDEGADPPRHADQYF